MLHKIVTIQLCFHCGFKLNGHNFIRTKKYFSHKLCEYNIYEYMANICMHDYNMIMQQSSMFN